MEKRSNICRKVIFTCMCARKQYLWLVSKQILPAWVELCKKLKTSIRVDFRLNLSWNFGVLEVSSYSKVSRPPKFRTIRMFKTFKFEEVTLCLKKCHVIYTINWSIFIITYIYIPTLHTHTLHITHTYIHHWSKFESKITINFFKTSRNGMIFMKLGTRVICGLLRQIWMKKFQFFIQNLVIMHLSGFFEFWLLHSVKKKVFLYH